MEVATFLIYNINYDEYKEMRDILIWKYPLIYLTSEYLGHLEIVRIVFNMNKPYLQSPFTFLEKYKLKQITQIMVRFEPMSNEIIDITEQKVEL